MTGDIPAHLLTPTQVEMDNARAAVARIAGDSVGGTYVALAVQVSGRPGEIVRALRMGDVVEAARLLRTLAAVDLAAAEQRERITTPERATYGVEKVGRSIVE